MIKPWIFLAAAAAVSLFAYPLMADDASINAQDRREMTDAAKREIVALVPNEVPMASLGEWKDVVESTVFLLMRRSEIYRGELRLLAVADATPIARAYPDGTLVVSTGLLDFIDASLFDEAASSPRRMRNFDSEREAMLAPFIAFEAARFALDQPFASWKATAASGSDRPFAERVAPAHNDVFAADSIAPAILRAAGLNADAYPDWIASLERLAASDADYAPAIARFNAAFPSPAIRLSALKQAAERSQAVSGHVALILAALSSGSGLDDAATSSSALLEDRGDAWWFRRLDAIVAHKRWIESVPARERVLIAEFPIAGSENPALRDALAERRPTHGAAQSASQNAMPGAAALLSKIPGDQGLWLSALESYKKARSIRGESGLLASGAMLLAWSGNSALREQAIADARAAFEAERFGTSQVARINLASILYLTDRDRSQSRALIEESLISARASGDVAKTGAPAQSPTYARVSEGYPGDGRDAIFNASVILLGLGERDKSTELRKEAARLYDEALARPAMEFRKARVGVSADDLLAAWGKPSEILSVYPDEWWVYNSLGARVFLAQTKKNDPLTVRSITLQTGSAVSFAKDTRVGDPAKDFTSTAGKPTYRSGDADVYYLEGTAVGVFSLSGKIRGIRAGY